MALAANPIRACMDGTPIKTGQLIELLLYLGIVTGISCHLFQHGCLEMQACPHVEHPHNYSACRCLWAELCTQGQLFTIQQQSAHQLLNRDPLTYMAGWPTR
jgi:hypothetical protein